MRVRCPTNPVEPNLTVVGCGREYDYPDHLIEDDPDGWVDCPHCGLGFDPTSPLSAPQPNDARDAEYQRQRALQPYVGQGEDNWTQTILASMLERNG